jgi:hypothetical protein
VFPGAPPITVSEDDVPQFSLRARFLAGRRRRGAGPTGGRNEYNRVVALRHENSDAAEAMELYDRFARRVACRHLPSWFYLALGCARGVPLRRKPKPGRTAEQTPPRPIAVGERCTAAISGALYDEMLPALRDHLAPQQLAVGVSGGAGILVHGARTSIATRPRYVLASLDMTDGFQNIRRDVTLERVSRVRGGAALCGWYHAMHGPEADILVGPSMTPLFGGDRGDSAEGVRQGAVESSATFCVGIHDEVVQLDSRLVSDDGWGRFYMDDGFAFGPEELVLAAVADFIVAARENTGSIVSGVTVYSAQTDLRESTHMRQASARAGVPFEIGGVTLPDGSFARGLEVMGAPIGEPAYERHVFEAKVEKAVSTIDTTISLLQSRSPLALHCLTYSGLQSRIDYRLQLASSLAVVSDGAIRFDAALERAVQAYTVEGLFTDPLLRRRVRLPGRRGGMGIRSRRELAPVAFVSSYITSAESFLSGPLADGSQQRGFFPALAELFGTHAFSPSGGDRFARFLTSGLAIADELRTAWSSLRAECGMPAEGPLSLAADDAGRSAADTEGPRSLQRRICSQVEAHRASALDADLRRLPPVIIWGKLMPDPRAASWASACAISRGWVYARPSAEYEPSPDEFREITTTYLGAASPLALRLGVGCRVQDSANRRVPLTLDQWGFALGVANTSGDHWRRQHDTLSAVFCGDAARAGLDATDSVRGLFADLLPSAVHSEWERRREGIVPDGSVSGVFGSPDDGRTFLWDVKLIRFTESRYRRSDVAPDARAAAAVSRRADAVHAEYVRHARELDERHHGGIADPDARPIYQRLLSYPRVVGLSMGVFAEASPDVHKLCTATAHAAALRGWRAAGARTPTAARSSFVSIYRRRWGCAAALGNARLRVLRAGAVVGARDRAPPDTPGTFDPTDPADLAAFTAHVEGGQPAGQGRGATGA